MDTIAFVANLQEVLESLLSDTKFTQSPRMATGKGVTTISFPDGGRLTLITTSPFDLAHKNTGQGAFTGC